ncbi:MAG: polyphosphate kinase 2 family protein [Clostridia bacterium]|nr:polyphosphate kinase 2 family protein [Clostridia bacterium]
MKPKDYRYNSKRSLIIKEAPAQADEMARKMKDELIMRTEENIERMSELQQRLYASGKEGLIVLLQGMDASGKDSLIRRLFSGLNPQGVRVYSFKAPAGEELRRDYLWRVTKCLPERGMISIFNRSHYEDAVTVGVEKLYEKFNMPERCLGDEIIDKRLEQIRNFEQYLFENGIRVVKLFLNISRDEQKKRLLERLDQPRKNWKFSPDDLASRARWDDYMAAYEYAINRTATGHCPWYVLPADNKWLCRYLASEAILDALKNIDPQYPEPDPSAISLIDEYRKALEEA